MNISRIIYLPYLTFVAFFLAINVYIRFISLSSTAYSFLPIALLGSLVLPAFVIFRKTKKIFSSWLISLLFGCIGFSIFLFGFHSYSVKNQLFEFFLTISILCIFIENYENKLKSNQVVLAVFLYSLITLFSIFLYPWYNIIDNVIHQGFNAFSIDVLNSPPSATIHYSLAGLNRLFLFTILVYELFRLEYSRKIYLCIFSGIAVGSIFCIACGFFDYFRIIDLNFYNMGRLDYVFNSTFLNKGWFAEYIIISFSFIFVLTKNAKQFESLVYYLYLPLVSLALIFSASRSSWLAFPICLIIFFAFRHKFIHSECALSFFNKKRIIIYSVISCIFITCMLIAVSSNSFKLYVNKSFPKIYSFTNSTSAIILNKIKNFSASDRPQTWKTAYAMIHESPLFGFGYESYRNNVQALYNIDNSYIRTNVPWTHYRDTIHNLYLQIFVNNGLIGLFLYLVLISLSLYFLFVDVKINKNITSLSCITSIVGFHIYGIFQSMQYISIIWLLLFLCIGYSSVVSINAKYTNMIIFKILLWTCTFFIIISLPYYVLNSGFDFIKEKYGVSSYLPEENSKYIGFYSFEKWPIGEFAWMSKCGRIHIRSANQTELSLYCAHPDVSTENPVMVSIARDGKHYTAISFDAPGMQTLPDFLPLHGNQTVIEICSSRSWNPRVHSNSPDFRTLGVAVKKIRDFPGPIDD